MRIDSDVVEVCCQGPRGMRGPIRCADIHEVDSISFIAFKGVENYIMPLIKIFKHHTQGYDSWMALESYYLDEFDDEAQKMINDLLCDC